MLSFAGWTAAEIFEDFDLLVDYLGLVIPLGISAAATSLMCLVSAKEAGDPYPVRESLIADGIGTCIASFFGSPFGTVLYVSSRFSGARCPLLALSYTYSPSCLLLGIDWSPCVQASRGQGWIFHGQWPDLSVSFRAKDLALLLIFDLEFSCLTFFHPMMTFRV
jgi:hypothetical protein